MWPERCRRGAMRRKPLGRSSCRWPRGWVQQTPTTYRMDVSAGHATVTAVTAEPQLSLDARALAQLYSGYLTPRQAVDLGLLTVHDPAALGRAQAIFAGPTAYLADFF